MKINKNSWHYRLSSKLNGNSVKQDLCGYFRELILGIILLIFIVCLGLAMLAGYVYFPLAYLFDWSKEYWMFTVGNVGWLLTGGVGLFFLVLFIKNSLPAKSHKPDGLVMSWYKAKKSKYCPLLEFTDD